MYRILLLLLILITVSGCISKKDKTGSDNDHMSNASWIGDGHEQPVFDSLYYEDDPAPLFRKEFSVEAEVESATLYITAAGYCKASLNGIRVGDHLLDPEWTDYSKRIYYSEYDVTSSIKKGTNCIGVTLGNGFYNPLPMRMWGGRNLRNVMTVGRPVFIARLVLTKGDGNTVEIITDHTWNYAGGPIVKNNVYLGEVYDARKEMPGWNLPGFDDSDWQKAGISNGPGGVLQKSFFPPIQATDILTPVNISSPRKGIYVVDMGVNFSGTYYIKLSGNKGDTITFRFGERIYGDGTLNPMTTVCGQIKRKGMGGPGAPDIAWQTDSYIIGDQTEAWYNPEFTFHTYRYMEISGLESKPDIADIQGIAFHTNVENRNSFICSSGLLNSIQDATERTFLSNLTGVQSDCPARERFGYGGDLNATSESFIYNFDMQAFYRKTIYDWVDAMNDSGFVDTAPFVGIQYCGISWESAYLITQYYLYLYYNDTEIIKEQYDRDKKWMEKAARLHPGGIVETGLSDHESLEPVPVELTGTCHYLQCARIMQLFASEMEDEESEKEYAALADRLKGLIKAEFWDKPVGGQINRQTLFSTLLYHGVIPDEELDAARDSLVTAVKNGPSGHFSTGIFGTKYVLETLSEIYSPGMVYDIVNSTAYPGWGFMIENGATTIWETWKESDNIYSNCHPMFGSVSEWFYRWLGGIRPDPENPGFKEFILAPSTPEGLEYVNCTYHSPSGQIVSNWEKEGPGRYRYEMKIPAGSIATVILPEDQYQSITIKRNKENIQPGKIDGLQSGKFKLDDGDYVITVLFLTQ